MLDFATSLVAEGKVNVASHGGKPLPPDALIGPDGAFSGDPALIYGPLTAEGPRDHTRGAGAIRAFGEHKGSGLALLCELLGGSLTGNGATEPDRKFANGMFSLYLDPSQDRSRACLRRRHDALSRLVPARESHPGRSDPDARRARAREPRKTRAEAACRCRTRPGRSIVATARSVGVNRDLSF